MSKSIFNSLVSYTPTLYIDPQENFLTELFAWILNNVPGFASEYISFLCQRIDGNLSFPVIDDGTDIRAETQITVSTGYIDLLIYTDKKINFICEHKINSELSEGQIQKYLDCKDQLGEGCFYTVLLTRAKWQHTQKADISLVWKDIDELVCSIIDNYNDDLANKFVLEQFSMFLKEKGLGRVEPMDANYLKNSYLQDKEKITTVDDQLCNMFQELSELNWKDLIPGIDTFRISEKYDSKFEVKYVSPKWGRIGIRFFEYWIPGVFAGVMYDVKDHKLEFSVPDKGPDFVILLDVDYKKNNEFNSFEWTKQMKERLVKDHAPYDKFVSSPKNPWRLAVLQKPFYDIIKDSQTYEEQKECVVRAIQDGVNLIIKNT